MIPMLDEHVRGGARCAPLITHAGLRCRQSPWLRHGSLLRLASARTERRSLAHPLGLTRLAPPTDTQVWPAAYRSGQVVARPTTQRAPGLTGPRGELDPGIDDVAQAHQDAAVLVPVRAREGV